MFGVDGFYRLLHTDDFQQTSGECVRLSLRSIPPLPPETPVFVLVQRRSQGDRGGARRPGDVGTGGGPRPAEARLPALRPHDLVYRAVRGLQDRWRPGAATREGVVAG